MTNVSVGFTSTYYASSPPVRFQDLDKSFADWRLDFGFGLLSSIYRLNNDGKLPKIYT